MTSGRPPTAPVAAHYNNRDFGTSRWQLGQNVTSASRAGGRGHAEVCCSAGGLNWPIPAIRCDAQNGVAIGGEADIDGRVAIARLTRALNYRTCPAKLTISVMGG